MIEPMPIHNCPVHPMNGLHHITYRGWWCHLCHAIIGEESHRSLANRYQPHRGLLTDCAVCWGE